MSREGFSDFLKAAEHRLTLREQVKSCKNYHEIISLAYSYGFHITLDDIQRENTFAGVENWFKTSKINPIRNHSR